MNHPNQRLSLRKLAGPIAALVISMGSTIPSFGQNNGNQLQIEGYIGKMTVKLTDDRKYAQLRKVVKDLKGRKDTLQPEFDKKQTAFQNARKAKKALEDAIAKIDADIATEASSQVTLKERLAKIKGNIDKHRPVLKLAKATADNTKAELQAAQKAFTDAGCKTDQPPANCAKLKKAVAEKRELNKTAQQDFKSKKEKMDKMVANRDEVKTKLTTSETAVATLVASKKEKNQQLKTAKQNLRAAKTAFDPVKAQMDQLTAGLKGARQKAKQRADVLIPEIKKFNQRGAQRGVQHGGADGRLQAEQRGRDAGTLQGERVGRREGIQAGQNRSYDEGFQSGSNEGINVGSADGQREGFQTGRTEGNTIAGERNGERDGIAEARSSDASSVGRRSGERDGLSEARSEGRRIGFQRGESQAVSKHEKTTSSNVINGPFAGSFQAGLPAYPNLPCRRNGQIDRRACPSFKPFGGKPMKDKPQIYRKAFRDGYKFRYHKRKRRAYNRNVQAFYDDWFARSRQRVFNDFASRDYPQFRQNGFNDGYNREYRPAYDRAYAPARNDARNQYANSPETNSSAYRNAYVSSKDSAYRAEYEAIRSAAYRRAKRETYDANIGAEIEKNRKIRFAAVEKVYLNSAVLKYEGARSVDAGVSGIAAKDAVYQPGEKVHHSMTLSNFGSKAAQNVVIVADNKSFTIGSIPAKTKISFKGAAETFMPGESMLGREHTESLRVKYALNATGKDIQGRHFENAGRNLLKTYNKTDIVQYPIQVLSMSTSSDVVIKEPNAANFELKNISARSFSGKIDAKLEINGNGQINVSSIPSLNGMGSNGQIRNVNFSINGDSNAYKYIEFDIVLSKNGVTLAKNASPVKTLVKINYRPGQNLPVVLTNSDFNIREVLDIIDEMGGTQNINMMDLSLPKSQSVVGKGIKNQIVIVPSEDIRNTKNSLIDDFIKASNYAALVFVDDNDQVTRGMSDVNRPNILKDMIKAQLKLDVSSGQRKLTLGTTSKYKSSVEGVNHSIQTNLRGLPEAMEIANLLKLSATDLIDRLNAEVTKDSIRGPLLSVQVLNARVASEFKAIYDVKKKEDVSASYLLFSKYKAKAGKKIRVSNLGNTLPAYVLEETFRSMPTKMSPIRGRIWKRYGELEKQLRKSFRKDLKKIDSKLHSWLKDNKHVNMPIDEDMSERAVNGIDG